MMKKMLIYIIILPIFLMVSEGGEAYGAGLKKTIAVSRFENRTIEPLVGTAMGDQLTDALMQSGKFVVLERQTLGDIIGEQDLAASGRTAVSKSAQTGKIVPAQILIKGTVTEFESEASSSGTGISFAGVSLGSSKTTAHVAIILRVIDTTSGEILSSVRVEGKSTGRGVKIGLEIQSVGVGSENFKKTPLGKAMQIAIDKGVVKIAGLLEDVPFQGKVIKSTEEMVYTNIGARNDVEVGEAFNIYSQGEALIDPDTGENLGSEDTLVGSIIIADVKEKFSKATVETGGYFEKGYIVKK